MRFRDLPIRRKLTLAILLTSAAALLLASGATMFFELIRFRHSLVRELSTEAEIIAANSAAPLAFYDSKAAEEILAALKVQPEIVHACLFTPDGKLFAEFKPKQTKQNLPVLVAQFPGHRFEKDYVLVFQHVRFGEDIVGSIGLRSDLREQNARLKASASIAVVALLTSLLVALVLSLKLQQYIATPVLDLAKVAHKVTVQKDYSLRATKQSNDEIGLLMEEFNQMLAQIEKRDADLRASEERFRQLAESIREVFWLTDVEKKQVFYVSPGFETIWGRSREELSHSPRIWLDSIHIDDRARILDAATTKQTTGEYDEEYRIVRPDKTIRWVHDRGFPVQDQNGKFYRVAGIAEDITKRKQTEHALQLAETKYRNIFENAIEGVFQTTPDGRFLVANPALARILGYASPEELIASVTNLGEQLCVDPKTRTELSRQLQKNDEVREFENQLLRKDGTRIWVSVNVRVQRNNQGQVLFYEGTSHDITERKRAEEALQRTEQVYRQAITGAGAVPYARDYKTKKYLFIGEEIERLIGYTPEEMQGNVWQQIKQEAVMLGETAGLTVEEAVKRVAAGEVKIWRCDMRVLTRDGESRWISDVSVQNLNESGELIGSMGILQDITDLKQAEKKSAAFSSLASQLSAAATPEEAASNILETAAELIGWDCAFVRLYDQERDRIFPILTYDLVDGKRTIIPSTDFHGITPVLRLIMEKGPLLINQESRASIPFKFSPFGNKSRASTSMIYVPIHQRSKVIGVLSIQRYTPNIYCQQDLNLLQALADHCSGALQRIQITERLREAESKYRAIFEEATEGIFQTTPEGRYLNVNPALARMFGYESAEEMLACVRNIKGQTYVLPEKRNEMKRLLDTHGSIQGFEAERYRRDGSKFWISINARVVRDASGAILYYEGTNRDITARRHLEKQLIEISDREQSRMGQDLHDGLCQHLVLTALAANLLEKDLSCEIRAHAGQAKKVARLVDEAITQARNLSRGLYPVKLEIEGLHSAMQELAANVYATYNIECEFESCDTISITDHALATHLYRIAQEAAVNAAKHAKPKHIQIRLSKIDNQIQLTISDDGIGIPAPSVRVNGMGLHIMNYRAGMIGGVMDIEQHSEGGTIVSCIFELKDGIERIIN